MSGGPPTVGGPGAFNTIDPGSHGRAGQEFPRDRIPGGTGLHQPHERAPCPTCNRLRLSSEGKIRPCLLRSQELDLKGPLRQGVSDSFLGYLFQEGIRLKHRKTSHSLACSGPCFRDLSMVSIGG